MMTEGQLRIAAILVAFWSLVTIVVLVILGFNQSRADHSEPPVAPSPAVSS